MKALRRLLSRLISWATVEQDEERLRAEIEEHLALQTAENVRRGQSPVEARRQAVLEFGPIESIKESYRQQRRVQFIETLARDSRHALRRLRKAPAFTAATVMTLALGIGATTAIFTLVHEVLLKSLPVANPSELYRLGKSSRCCYEGGYSQDREFSLVSYELYRYLSDNTKGFSELAAFSATEPLFGVRRAGTPEPAQSYPGEYVSGNYFLMFGISAHKGRVLRGEDDQESAPRVAVMSYRLWRERYNSDPSVVGSVFNVDGKPFTLVGVMPPSFFGDTLRSTPPDFFLPLNAEPSVESDADLKKPDTHWLNLIGRIRPGVGPALVETQMRLELKQWLSSHWNEMNADDKAKFPSQTLYLEPGGAGITSMREQYERWLEILMTFSAIVLVIVCANVASLMLIRGLERRRQISLSMALGAQPWAIVRQSLIESMVLSLFGGAAGIILAFEATRIILHFAFPPSDGLASIPIDAWPSMPVLLFALIVSILTGIAFGIVPAWISARVDPIEALRGASRVTAHAGSRSRQILVVLQAALSLVLLSASGLLMTALQRMEKQDLGFKQDRRIIARINPRLAGYQADELSLLYRRIHDSVGSIPGVTSVALCLYSPLGGSTWGSGVWIDGRPAPGPLDDNSAFWDRVTAGYFEAIGTPIIRGRGFSNKDTANSPKVAVINEAFARKHFKDEDPIGRHFGRTVQTADEYEVVGVAKDARYLASDLDHSVSPFFFLPEAQAEYANRNQGSLFLKNIVIESTPGANLSSTPLRQAMASVDPNMPIISIHSLSDEVKAQFGKDRLIARLTSLFAVVSLVLASIGLYGITAYNAGRRVNEVGVRMVLGAVRRDVVLLLMRGAFTLVGLGLLIGTPLALLSGRFLGPQLHGISTFNPLFTLAAVAVLGLSTLIGAVIPAARASLISPLAALREQE